MMLRLEPENRDRLKSAGVVGLIHALIGYVLLTGLGYSPSAAVPEALKLLNLAEELRRRRRPSRPGPTSRKRPARPSPRMRRAPPRRPICATRRPRSSPRLPR